MHIEKESVDCGRKLGCHMRGLRVVRVGVVVLAGVFGLLSGGMGYGQQAPDPARGNGSSQALASTPEKTTDDPHAATQPVSERQKKLAADTDKLLALATDLKKEVDKTNKDILSLDVVKKAEEIEKLARSMKTEKQ
jgi:hypothetical protein